MSCIRIVGGRKLEGEVMLQGSKNAVLPILAASVLCNGKVVIKRCPNISDVRELLQALGSAGIKSSLRDGELEVDTVNATPIFFGPEYAGKTRGGVLLLGAFLGRFGEAGMAYPGGCVIGARPIDLHCKVFRMMQAKLKESEEGVTVKGKLKGGKIKLPYPSVGATENGILAAVCAEGVSVISGAATEPEVTELCRFLRKAGAKIRGIGTSVLEITGGSRLHGVEYTLTGDRIVAGTYLGATAMTGGEILLRGTEGVCMKGIFDSFSAAGLSVSRNRDCIRLHAPGKILPIKELKTAPYPGFPTDMQSQMTAILSLAEGESKIYETVFESRFGVVPELKKMGADVQNEGRCIRIRGGNRLHGETVYATDLRTGAALVSAALAAEGESIVYGDEFIARGYEDICKMFRFLGADISETDEK